MKWKWSEEKNRRRPMIKWTEEMIVKTIKELKALSKPINPGYLRENYPGLYGAIGRISKGCYSLGWTKAVKKAGFKPEEEKVRRPMIKWTEEMIVKGIKILKIQGKPINPGYLRENYPGLYGAIGKVIGKGNFSLGWTKAVKKAGFKPKEEKIKSLPTKSHNRPI